MMRCETCRFMAGPREDAFPAYGQSSNKHRTCVRVIHANGTYDGELGPPSKAPAVVLDGSGYAARFAVLSTFGCVLHEPTDSGGEGSGDE